MSKYPSDWLSKPLGKVYPKIVVGYVGNVNDHYCRAEEGVPFYRTLNIRDGYFRHSEHLYVTHEFNEKNKKSQIANNDILIARVGANLGMVCKANGISGLANMANAIIIKTNDVNSADADFYTSFLLSPMGKNQIYSGAAGGAQGVFNTKLTQEIIVPVPPLPEQKKIAKILSTWDKAIATTEQLIATSQQQKKALMQQLLTGKKRLVNPETGKMFEGDWEEVKLGDICHVNPKKPKEPENGLVSFIPMDAVSEEAKLLRTASKLYSEVSKGFTAFTDNDTLVAKITPCFENGKGARVTDLENGIGFGSTEFHVLRAKTKICPQFIYFLTITSGFRIRGEMNMQGSAGQKRVTTDYLKSYKTLIPKDLKEQQKIASVLTAADKEIELLQAKLTHLKDEKKALMQQLLTGKRRVKVDENVAA